MFALWQLLSPDKLAFEWATIVASYVVPGLYFHPLTSL